MSAELPDSKPEGLENRVLPMCPCCGLSLIPGRVTGKVVWMCNGYDDEHTRWFREFVTRG